MSAPLFGAAGNEDAFFAAGHRTVEEAPAYARTLGLSAYEYQAGHGVRISRAGAQKLGAAAAAADIALSVHAPYYISMASEDGGIRARSVGYIVQAARAAAWMGAARVVVHPGACGKRDRADVLALACETFAKALAALDAEGLSDIFICPEVMGKHGQLGTLEEVLAICRLDARLVPCVDFGHLNARTGGALRCAADFSAVFDAIGTSLGETRRQRFHAHFSKIEYTAAGEKKHLTFADEIFGPAPEVFAAALAVSGVCPTVICESAGTQAADAAALSAMWQAAAKAQNGNRAAF